MTTAVGLQVKRSTPLIQLQDAGRFGVRHLGVTQGGALDWIALYWANWLLGNSLTSPVIEITLGNLDLLCQQEAQLAITGGDLSATLDDQPLAPWQSFVVRRGQRLRFGHPRQGARAYLAVPGGFEAAAVLGSCASVTREELGGLDGNGAALQAGDTLRWQGSIDAPPRQVPQALRPKYEAMPRLDVVMGAQIGAFTGQSLFDAFNATWTVDARADRMGVRLLGPTLTCETRSMASEGVPLGAIQVPPDGQPIALLNDRQTIGGYPRLGALTPQAIARLAQCLPGEELRLTATVQQAARQTHLRILRGWRSD